MLSQKYTRRLCSLAWMVMVCLTLNAQPDSPNNGRRPARQQVPIDGTEWLLIAGGIWGARKLLNRKR